MKSEMGGGKKNGKLHQHVWTPWGSDVDPKGKALPGTGFVYARCFCGATGRFDHDAWDANWAAGATKNPQPQVAETNGRPYGR